MNGQQLYRYYTRLDQTPADREYAGILTTGRVVVGFTRLFALLEEAETAGKRLELVYGLDPSEGPSDPYDLRLKDSYPFN